MFASRDVGVRAGEVDPVGVFQWNFVNHVWMAQVAGVEHLHTVGVGHKPIPKLHGDAVRMMKFVLTDHTGHLRAGWIVQIDHDEARVTTNVRVRTHDRDRFGTAENTVPD